MDKVDLLNFQKILNPVPAGTGDALEMTHDELVDALEKLKEKNENLLNKISGEEYVEYFKDYFEAVSSEEGLDLARPTGMVYGAIAGSYYPLITHDVWQRISEDKCRGTSVDKILDELSEKNQMIQALSVSLKVSDRLFARLLNKLSIGIVLFFLLTVIVCYLAFS